MKFFYTDAVFRLRGKARNPSMNLELIRTILRSTMELGITSNEYTVCCTSMIKYAGGDEALTIHNLTVNPVQLYESREQSDRRNHYATLPYDPRDGATRLRLFLEYCIFTQICKSLVRSINLLMT
jgi:hypothetical protein